MTWWEMLHIWKIGHGVFTKYKSSLCYAISPRGSQQSMSVQIGKEIMTILNMLHYSQLFLSQNIFEHLDVSNFGLHKAKRFVSCVDIMPPLIKI